MRDAGGEYSHISVWNLGEDNVTPETVGMIATAPEQVVQIGVEADNQDVAEPFAGLDGVGRRRKPGTGGSVPCLYQPRGLLQRAELPEQHDQQPRDIRELPVWAAPTGTALQ